MLKDVSFELLPGQPRSSSVAAARGKVDHSQAHTRVAEADGGEIVVNGKRVDTMSEAELMAVRTDIGMVFQEGALFDSLTVEGNVGPGSTKSWDAGRNRLRTRGGSGRVCRSEGIPRTHAV